MKNINQVKRGSLLDKTVLITGASSGLGAALARIYAASGARLFLAGRNADRLGEIYADCRRSGAEFVETKQVDVMNAADLADWIVECDQRFSLDLVIANAGVSYSFEAEKDDLKDHFKKTFGVNVEGVFNAVTVALPLMKARGYGQIALISSLAGYRGLPSSPAYSTSKVTVKAYGEALRGVYAPYGIYVNVVCPGFIETPMTDKNNFPMPFMMTADKAARIIKRKLEKNKGRIAFPWPMVAMIWAGFNLLPNGLVERILARSPRK
ncbi:MAG: short-chain dehydrogenase [Kordiimonas sp.]|nr:short-chain dehydrogenase [Kordiimonas sp.]